MKPKTQLEAALDACSKAVKLDPSTKAGELARQKKVLLGVQIDRAKAEKVKEAQAAEAKKAAELSRLLTKLAALVGQRSAPWVSCVTAQNIHPGFSSSRAELLAKPSVQAWALHATRAVAASATSNFVNF